MESCVLLFTVRAFFHNQIRVKGRSYFVLDLESPVDLLTDIFETILIEDLKTAAWHSGDLRCLEIWYRLLRKLPVVTLWVPADKLWVRSGLLY